MSIRVTRERQGGNMVVATLCAYYEQHSEACNYDLGPLTFYRREISAPEVEAGERPAPEVESFEQLEGFVDEFLARQAETILASR